MAKDDLTKIDGIGKKLAAALVEHGVDSFARLAALDDDGIATLEGTNDFKGRNDWPAWIKAASALAPAAGADTQANNARRFEGALPSGKVAVGGNTMDIAWPPPAGMPAAALEGALFAVKAKPERGRWRAGRKFSREETTISLAELDDDQRAAIAGDPELVVSLRLVEPE
ncbi:MAG: hypothetical protein GC182_03140 [Rhodopseudomonas sp.]|nr:hypothetical protein [Rhodopseudomonas sp.]